MPSNWIRREKRIAIYLRDGLKCVYCNRAIEDEIVLTLDHLHVRSDRGSNSERNLITSCHDCNTKRGTKPLLDWLNTFENGDDLLGVIMSQTRKSIRPFKLIAKKLIETRTPPVAWRSKQ